MLRVRRSSLASVAAHSETIPDVPGRVTGARLPLRKVLPVLFFASLTMVACGGGPPRVVFVGIDGASWTVLGPLIERGEAPGFAKLMQEGAYMRQFETMRSTKSPVVWTSVATGRDYAAHGITNFTQTLKNGRVIPVTSSARNVKAIWNIATEAGKSVGVVGWWASWPAEIVNGYMITDHANPAAARWMMDDRKRYWSADPEVLKDLENNFYPLNLAATLEGAWLPERRLPAKDFRERSRLTEAQMRQLIEAPWYKRTAYSWLKTFYVVDFPLFRLAHRLYHERPTDLQMLYLRGPDPVQHYAWDLVEPDRYAVKPANLARDRGIVEGIYRYVDSFLLEFLDSISSNTTLIVASDHGAEPSADATGPEPKTRPGEHSRTAKGVLFIRGPNVRRGHELARGNPMDLMPTMAWLLGLPLSKELEGEALTEAFESSFASSHPVQWVEAYDVHEKFETITSPEDDELLEQLRALGYIE